MPPTAAERRAQRRRARILKSGESRMKLATGKRSVKQNSNSAASSEATEQAQSTGIDADSSDNVISWEKLRKEAVISSRKKECQTEFDVVSKVNESTDSSGQQQINLSHKSYGSLNGTRSLGGRDLTDSKTTSFRQEIQVSQKVQWVSSSFGILRLILSVFAGFFLAHNALSGMLRIDGSHTVGLGTISHDYLQKRDAGLQEEFASGIEVQLSSQAISGIPFDQQGFSFQGVLLRNVEGTFMPLLVITFSLNLLLWVSFKVMHYDVKDTFQVESSGVLITLLLSFGGRPAKLATKVFSFFKALVEDMLISIFVFVITVASQVLLSTLEEAMLSAVIKTLEQNERNLKNRPLSRTKGRISIPARFKQLPVCIEKYKDCDFFSVAAQANRITEIERHKFEKDNRLLAKRLSKIYTRKPKRMKKALKLGMNRSEERKLVQRRIRRENNEIAKRLSTLSARHTVSDPVVEKHFARESKASRAQKTATLATDDFELYCNLIPNKDRLRYSILDYSQHNISKPETYLRFSREHKKSRLKEKLEMDNYKRDNIRLFRRLCSVKSQIRLNLQPTIPAKNKRRVSVSKQKSSQNIEFATKFSTFQEQEKIILDLLDHEVSDMEPMKIPLQTQCRQNVESIGVTQHNIPKLQLNSRELRETRENKRRQFLHFDEESPMSARTIERFVLSQKSPKFKSLQTKFDKISAKSSRRAEKAVDATDGSGGRTKFDRIGSHAVKTIRTVEQNRKQRRLSTYSRVVS